MLPRQPYTRSGAWDAVTHPGHGDAGCTRFDHRVGEACMRSLRVDRYVAKDSCLRTSGHGQHRTAVARMPSRRLEACATGSACSPLMQRDMWVMHSPSEEMLGGGRDHAPTPARPRWGRRQCFGEPEARAPSAAAMRYPHLVLTTCVSAGMIAMDAVLSDWPGGSAPLQPCHYVLDRLPYPLVMRVSRSLECGSHAAAPAVLTIRRVGRRYPSWSRGCWMYSFRSSSR